MTTIKNERLEMLTTKVRQGIPISYFDAIEIIEYQNKLKVEQELVENKTFFGKLKKKLIKFLGEFK